VESSPRVRVEVGSELYRGSKDDFDRVNWFALISNWPGENWLLLQHLTIRAFETSCTNYESCLVRVSLLIKCIFYHTGF
jgi:hypothetical protein